MVCMSVFLVNNQTVGSKSRTQTTGQIRIPMHKLHDSERRNENSLCDIPSRRDFPLHQNITNSISNTLFYFAY